MVVCRKEVYYFCFIFQFPVEILEIIQRSLGTDKIRQILSAMSAAATTKTAPGDGDPLLTSADSSPPRSQILGKRSHTGGSTTPPNKRWVTLNEGPTTRGVSPPARSGCATKRRLSSCNSEYESKKKSSYERTPPASTASSDRILSDYPEAKKKIQVEETPLMMSGDFNAFRSDSYDESPSGSDMFDACSVSSMQLPLSVPQTLQSHKQQLHNDKKKQSILMEQMSYSIRHSTNCSFEEVASTNLLNRGIIEPGNNSHCNSQTYQHRWTTSRQQHSPQFIHEHAATPHPMTNSPTNDHNCSRLLPIAYQSSSESLCQSPFQLQPFPSNGKSLVLSGQSEMVATQADVPPYQSAQSYTTPAIEEVTNSFTSLHEPPEPAHTILLATTYSQNSYSPLEKQYHPVLPE